MYLDFTSLNSFLYSTTNPTLGKKPKIFLGIAEVQHFENVISNVYDFFFNVHKKMVSKICFSGVCIYRETNLLKR